MPKERTIPTKEQVLAVAKQYPQWEEELTKLFPEDFEEKHIEIDGGSALICYLGNEPRIVVRYRGEYLYIDAKGAIGKVERTAKLNPAYRLMKDGIITIMVRDGKVVSAEVGEF